MTNGRAKTRTIRRIVGILAAAMLLTLIAFLPRKSALTRSGVVEAGRTFQLTRSGVGEYRWSLLEGGGVTQERVLRFEQNDLVELQLADGIRSGASVTEGQPLVRLSSPQAQRQVESLRQTLSGLEERRAQLAGGMRPEEVTQAWREVQRAEANREWLRAEAARLRTLYDEKAVGAGELESAELAARVGEAEVALARAAYSVARAPASPEVFAEIDGRTASLSAQLAALENLVGEEIILSPLRGVVDLGGPASRATATQWRASIDGLESVGDVSILQVYDLERCYVRVSLTQEQREQLAPGDPISFQAPGLPAFAGQIESISASAESMGGEAVFWARAALDGGSDRLRPGMTGTARLQLAARAGDVISDNLLTSLWRDVISSANLSAADEPPALAAPAPSASLGE